MLFCRRTSVAVLLLSVIGTVCSATTPRLRGEAKTSNDHPPSTTSVVENATKTADDNDFELTTDVSERQTTTRTSLDGPTLVLRGEDVAKNGTSDERVDASMEGGTEIDDIASDGLPHRTTRTGFSRTDDEFRTRRGIVLVDEDFNVSPDPDVKQGWSEGSTTNKSPKTTTEDEGSGQDEPPPPPTPSPDLEGSGGDPVEPPELCVNSTCDSNDMSVFPGHGEVVPAGTNLSLSCVQSNESLLELRWYKYDDDGRPLLLQQADLVSSEVTFSIPGSRTEDSGRYVCVRASAGSCCHRTLHVKVHEVPNYRYHLIVVGVVAAVSLFACLLLGVHRNYKTKKYEVQLELQNMESDCVYKM